MDTARPRIAKQSDPLPLILRWYSVLPLTVLYLAPAIGIVAFWAAAGTNGRYHISNQLVGCILGTPEIFLVPALLYQLIFWCQCWELDLLKDSMTERLTSGEVLPRIIYLQRPAYMSVTAAVKLMFLVTDGLYHVLSNVIVSVEATRSASDLHDLGGSRNQGTGGWSLRLRLWPALFILSSHIIGALYILWTTCKLWIVLADQMEVSDLTSFYEGEQELLKEPLSQKSKNEKLLHGLSEKSRDSGFPDHRPTPPDSPTPTDMMGHPQSSFEELEERINGTQPRSRSAAPARLVTWKCSCGSSLSDWYTEITPGSLECLQSQLREEASPCASRLGLSWPDLGAWISSKLTAGSFSAQQSTNTTQGPAAPTSSSAGLRSQTHTPSSIPGGPVQVPSQPLSSPVNFSSQGQTAASLVCYLLLCIPEKLSGFRLYHQQLLQTPGSARHPNYVVNDQQLFQLLRRKYATERSIGFSQFWPRTVIRVSLAHFLVDASDFVDLRHYACHGASADCKCIPPANDNLYHCTPRPSPYTPPIGTNYLTHLFQHPECINKVSTRVLNQVPKRFGQCIATTGAEAVEAWGMEFEEGWDRDRLKNAILLVIAATLVFGILWAVLKHDIQGACGIAAFFMSAVATFGGYMASKEPRISHR
ncbi:hypothetical protein AYL99_09679 [Fonsecaea erecta]|uniref:Uncharacterized protein n=1 Tax=Fonsecaea erecta TaxID=1367422 RepID=A0A178Z9Q2_9EURO|nr:hypothetical protein AYL99_09679 [Fonsecaea erecta]OAP56500.1 hypothetical protein AYL99_09679 [Fonsecaea erecta]